MVVPTGWKQVMLKDLGSFSKGSGISKAELVATGLNAIRYGELYMWHHFKIKKIRSFISEESAKASKKIKFGDIIFAGSGETIDEIGKSAAYLFHEDCYAGGDTIILSPKNCNSLFLSFLLNTGNARKELRRLGQGQSVVHIYKKDLESVIIILPSLSEQEKIVEVLESWDSYLEKLARVLKFKRKIKEWLMQKLLTGQIRLENFSKPWEFLKLGDICDISRGGSPRPIQNYLTKDESGYNWLRIGDIKPGDRFVFQTKEKIIKEGLKKTTLVNPGDFILSNSMSFGRPYIMKISACIHDGWLAFRNLKGNIDKNYLYYKLLSKKIQNDFISLSAGSGVQNLKKETVSTLILELPPIDEQTAIANVLTTADQEIEALEKKKGLIMQQKNFLLNNLITGKIRLPEFTH